MPLKFVSTVDVKQPESVIAKSLKAALKTNTRVLWIITGGSNIALAANIMKHISVADSAKLAIMLSDERYGEVGHPDSNLKQLYDAGFKPKKAIVVPVLRPGATLEMTVELYDQAVHAAFHAADSVIALLGIGPDGHIAGILPGSEATKESEAWVVGYKTPEFIRITLTPYALSQVSLAFSVANGAAKLSTLKALMNKTQPVSKQPAQILKQVPEATVFSDQVGVES
ncbi:MAG TPA: 6-phosphogluconolactonase [Candidatus Binatia bacterium]|nr:6-phosphogluconolactonase [Candidatus Binatia bacterium]